MKIVHVADTHLGYQAYSGKLDPDRNLNQRECDVYSTWHEAVEKAVALRPAAFIHAGDLFDSSRPAPRAVAEALDGFARLREAEVPAIVIAGNHETPRFRSGGSVFEILQRFGVRAVWGEPETISIGGLAIHAVPHEPKAERLVEDINSLKLDPKADANMLVLHAGLEALPRQGYGEVNEIELDPEVLTELEYDYIALGHLHRFQAPQVNAIYPGSLERLGFYDVDGQKGFVEIDLASGAGSDRFVTFHEVSARSLIDIPLACQELDANEVVTKIEAAAKSYALEDSVVRVRLDEIARDTYQALDFSRVDDIFESCLHHLTQVGRSGLAAGTGDLPSEVSFDAFARSRMPKNVDAEAVIGLARRYLGDAAQAEVEEAAE